MILLVEFIGPSSVSLCARKRNLVGVTESLYLRHDTRDTIASSSASNEGPRASQPRVRCNVRRVLPIYSSRGLYVDSTPHVRSVFFRQCHPRYHVHLRSRAIRGSTTQTLVLIPVARTRTKVLVFVISRGWGTILMHPT